MADLPEPERIEIWIQDYMQSYSIPGLSLAVVRKGQVVKAGGYGLANVELDAPATPTSVYQIQSMTKSFVASGLMVLVQEGRLQLDDPLISYLGQLPPTWSNITIRHLLTMTSGIQHIFVDHPSDEAMITFAQQVTNSDEIVIWASERPLHFTPGTQFHYSSTNYHLLGLIIQKVSGLAWHEFLHERFFEPLGMRQTRVVTWDELIPQRVAGYIQVDGVLYNGYYMTPAIMASAAGGLYSTVLDLAKWDAALQEGYPLSPAILEEMWTPTQLNNGKLAQIDNGLRYGLGWWLLEAPDQRVIIQLGDNLTGFTSMSARFVNEGITVIILANLSPLDIEPLVRAVAEYYIQSLQ
jgi:D-alanyl-D-alanine carboxypeptidase